MDFVTRRHAKRNRDPQVAAIDRFVNLWYIAKRHALMCGAAKPKGPAKRVGTTQQERFIEAALEFA
jgi:hypothetical protein